ncbi:MAG: hypothetical protein M1561_04045 [Gammaproteobacteria bacterium]|nr:hypothetical protein [Gammaproteobacteria bacterium]
MCFSATASFTVGAALIAISFYTIKSAYAKNKQYLLFACMPLFFGLQQIIEGLVWVGILQNNSLLIKIASLIFLLFALAFWPIFTPLSLYVIETKNHEKRKMLLLALFIVGLIAGVVSYLSVLISMHTLSVKVVFSSINYSGGGIYSTVANFYTVAYVLATILPFFIVSNLRLRVFGVTFLFSAIVANYFYIDRRISVWCFFAAIISAFVIYLIYKLPKSEIRLSHRKL